LIATSLPRHGRDGLTNCAKVLTKGVTRAGSALGKAEPSLARSFLFR